VGYALIRWMAGPLEVEDYSVEDEEHRGLEYKELLRSRYWEERVHVIGGVWLYDWLES